MAGVEERISITWAMTPEDLNFLEVSIRSSEHITFDLETTGLDEHATTGGRSNGGIAARVVLASFTMDLEDSQHPRTWVLPLSHPQSPFLGEWREVMARIARAIWEEGISLSGHNVKFDTRYLAATVGVDLSDLVEWDTEVSSALEDENDSTRLEARAARVFGVPEWGQDLNLTYPGAAEEVDLFTLGEYAGKDTYYTHKLREYHRNLFFVDLDEEERPEGSDEISLARIGHLAQEVSMPMVASLSKMEQRGIMLDVEWAENTLKEVQQQAEAARQYLIEAVPSPRLDPEKVSFAPTSNWFGVWAEEAEAAGMLEVVATTRLGNPQWNRQALDTLARKGFTLAQKLLEYRKFSKRAEFLNSWLEKVTPESVIHSTYRATGTVTGRLSSAGPNMQQVTHSLRPAFIPRPGYVIADIDYSQIEMRVAAEVSGCEPMMEAFQEGQDLHRIIARQILQQRVNAEGQAVAVKLEDVSPEDRQAGKAANFGLLYGMAAAGFQTYAETAYEVFLTLEEAHQIYEAFFTTWDGLAEWHMRMIARGKRLGYVTSPIGRVRRLPHINSYNDRLASEAERLAINAPVQGFASDLMQLATASIQGLIPGYRRIDGAYPIATVHDSIVLEVREDDWEEITRKALNRMVNLNPILRRMDFQLRVPIAAEAVVGSRWGLNDIGELEDVTL